MADWSHVPELYRRAGGRRRFNAARRLHADERRHLVLMLSAADISQREMARLLCCHESQISRDVALLNPFHFPPHRCRHCGVTLGRLALRPWQEEPQGLTLGGQELLGRVRQVLRER